MSDRRIKITGAVSAAIIVILLIVFQQNAISDEFIEDYNLEVLNNTERIFVYNDFDGLPATGTSVYMYKLDDIEFDFSEWNTLPFDIDSVYICLEKADIDIKNAYYVYNESDRNEDDDLYFDIAIYDEDLNVIYHVIHKNN